MFIDQLGTKRMRHIKCMDHRAVGKAVILVDNEFTVNYINR